MKIKIQCPYIFCGTLMCQDEQNESRSGTPKRRPLLLQKKGSSKRRLAPLHSEVADSLSKVPQLRYTLTVEELERDRQAERERVLQTLDEVEEEHRAKQGTSMGG